MTRIFLYPDKKFFGEALSSFEGVKLTAFSDTPSLLRRLKSDGADALIIDGDVPHISGIVRFLLEHTPTTALVVVGNENVKNADLFIPREVSVNDFSAMLRKFLEVRGFLLSGGILGRSRAIYSVGEIALKLARTDISVLVVGESGVGKELVARLVHNRSERSSGEFVPVNVGAIPESLLESELFGYVKGAFTGAVSDRIGLFERASGGTLFLDEIGDMPVSLQVKLLRVLETGRFYPVGSSEERKADVRIIAATNRDLKLEMDMGRFRSDLYFRLAGAKIYIPPLRERREDIPVLVASFIKEVEKKTGKPFPGFTDSAMRFVLGYHWPGNVRELRNFIENFVSLAEGSPVTGEDIKGYFAEHSQTGRKLPVRWRENIPSEMAVILESILEELNYIRRRIDSLVPGGSLNIEESERELIENALKLSGWNKSNAARILGIDRKTLYRKMKRYEIKED